MKIQNIGQSDSRCNGLPVEPTGVPVVFVRTCQIWQMVAGESKHLLPVGRQKPTHIQYIYMHIHCSALTEAIALLQTHKNSTYGLMPFPSLAGHDEGCLVGMHICT